MEVKTEPNGGTGTPLPPRNSTGGGGAQPARNTSGGAQPARNGPGGAQPARNGPGGAQPARNGPGAAQPARNGPGGAQSARNGPGGAQAARNGPAGGQAARNGPNNQNAVDKKPRSASNNNRGGGGNNGRGGQKFGRGGQQRNINAANNNNNNQANNRSQNNSTSNSQQIKNEVVKGNNDNTQFSGHGKSDDRKNRKSEDYMINSRLKNINGPTHDISPIENEELKFSGRNRLYIGNLTNDITEEEIKELFKPYGEISESFINKEKNFAFIKVDYHANAEKAKKELDGYMRKNRPIRIRFAPNATSIRVKNLTQWISNELLYRAFEVFGQVERAVIIVDDRGKPTGEGIVEFARKSGAMTALRYCQERCFFLTSSLRPCVVELFEHIDDTDGFPEKSLLKKNQEFVKARNNGPRLAEVGSFEHEYGTRWKQLHELYKQKQEALKREIQMEEEKLDAQMQYVRYEHETELLRDQLREREQDRDRQKMEWELKERQVEEQRTRDEQQMRRQEDDMQIRMQRQEEELRRRQQENTLFMKAQQLNSMLDQQEMNQGRKNFDSNDNRRNYDMMNQGGVGNQDSAFMDYDNGHNSNNNNNRPSRFDDDVGNNQGQRNGGNNNNNNNRQWISNNDRRDDFPNKRRRF